MRTEQEKEFEEYLIGEMCGKVVPEEELERKWDEQFEGVEWKWKEPVIIDE